MTDRTIKIRHPLTASYAHADTTVHTADLVDASLIAKRCGVTRAAVSNWLVRDVDFPAPVWTGGRFSLWHWPTVKEWYASRN